MRRTCFALALVLAATLASGCLTTANGSHTGYVTASECGGVIWTTCRLWLKTNVQSSQEDEYCVEHGRSDFSELDKDPEPPSVGEYTVCPACAALLIYGAGLIARVATHDDVNALTPAQEASVIEIRSIVRDSIMAREAKA